MGKLLSNTPAARSATAADRFADYIRRSAGGRRNMIDMSSATTMSLWPSVVVGQRTMTPLNLTSSLSAYPFLHQRDFRLEDEFIRFLRRWISVSAHRDEVVVTNGVYGGLRTFAQSRPEPIVLIPELMHEINKDAFRALGKRVIEYPIVLTNGAIDLPALAQRLARYRGNIAFVYIYHAKAFVPTRSYVNRLAGLLARYDCLGALDLDCWYTSHHTGYVPAFPLSLPAVRRQVVTFMTMSKELGVPGLRIGFAVGPTPVIATIKHFQQRTLEMVPMTSRVLATEVLARADMRAIRRTLQQRMKVLANGLRRIGFPVTIPPAGINLFVHVPASYESSLILPDHLFAFDVWERTGVLLRPGSLHGHRLNHWVRFVIGQNEKTIDDVLRRFKQAHISHDMVMPPALPTNYRQRLKA